MTARQNARASKVEDPRFVIEPGIFAGFQVLMLDAAALIGKFLNGLEHAPYHTPRMSKSSFFRYS